LIGNCLRNFDIHAMMHKLVPEVSGKDELACCSAVFMEPNQQKKPRFKALNH